MTLAGIVTEDERCDRSGSSEGFEMRRRRLLRSAETFSRDPRMVRLWYLGGSKRVNKCLVTIYKASHVGTAKRRLQHVSRYFIVSG